MAVRLLSRSFAGGEVMPGMADRVDLGQYQTGLAKCINAIIYPHGEARKRAGTTFVNFAKCAWQGDVADITDRNVRLIPFQFSNSQSYVIELGHKYIRFHTESGTVLEGVDVAAEMIRSEGVSSGTPNRIQIFKKNHGLLAGKKIYVTATPRDGFGTEIGTISAVNAVSTSGSISGTVFTDTTHGSGMFEVGQLLTGAGIPAATYITALGTGTGSNDGGTYTINNSVTVGSITITGTPKLPMLGEPGDDPPGIAKNDYWTVSDAGSAFLSRPANAGYLLRAKAKDPYDVATSTAASFSGTTFTDTTHGTGNYAVGHKLFGAGVPDGTYITALVTGTGANDGGTYTINQSVSITGPITVTGWKEDTDLWEIVPMENWAQFDGTTEYTVEDTEDGADPDVFCIDIDSSLTGGTVPPVSFSEINRAKQAKVTALAHGFSNGDIVHFRLTNRKKCYFDASVPYKVSDVTTDSFKIKVEVLIDQEAGTTEWQYVNTKKMLRKGPLPKGLVGTTEFQTDVDLADATYTVIRAVTGNGTSSFFQESHGFYDGQVVWYEPENIAPYNREGFYRVEYIDADYFNLVEYPGATAIKASDTGPVLAGYVYPIYEIATDYDTADVPYIDYAQSFDVVTLTHTNYPVATLSRYGAADWVYEAEKFVPRVDVPDKVAKTVNGNTGTDQRYIYYAVTAVEDGEESLPTFVERDPLVVSKISNRITYERTPYFYGNGYFNDPRSLYTLTGSGFKLESGTLPYNALIRLEAGDDTSDDFIAAVEGDEMNDNIYRVAARLTNGWYVVARRSKTPIDWTLYEGDLASGDLSVYRSGSVQADLNQEGCNVQLQWKSKPNVRYNIYKRVGAGGDVLGYIGTTTDGFFTDDNITPDMSQTVATGEQYFEAADDYPACVEYFSQRKAFAGTNNRPQNVWLTRIGTESNLLQSLPVRATDSIQFRMAGREQNRIKFMAALRDLILFTESGEWRVSSANGVLTPSTTEVSQQSAAGCAPVKPVTSGNSILFVQAGSNRVMSLNFNWNAQSYMPDDVSIMASHLFEGREIVSMAVERNTFPILWCVRDDGIMVGLTFVPEQNVVAWWRFETDGLVKAVTSVKESSGSVVWVSVYRNGWTTIEKMDNYTHWRNRTIFMDAETSVVLTREGVQGDFF